MVLEFFKKLTSAYDVKATLSIASLAIGLGTTALHAETPTPNPTQFDPEIETCLVIAIDASESVSADEWALQTQGLAQGFRHSASQGAADSRGKIAVLDIIYGNQSITSHSDWHIIDTAADMAQLSAYFQTLNYNDYAEHVGITNVLDVANVAIDKMGTCPNPEAERIIHVLGDGADEEALPQPYLTAGQNQLRLIHHNLAIEELHSRAYAEGDITINGSSFGNDHIDEYFANNIVSPHGHNFDMRDVTQGLAGGQREIEKAVILQVVRHTM